MCVSAGPAKFSRTIVYSGLANRAGKRVHVMGYQNQAENLAPGPNCMILHIPSAAPMEPDNMVDTSECPSVLQDLARATRPLAMGAPRSASAGVPLVHVFQKGIYTVVLANHWQLAYEALDRVPVASRPVISASLLEFYGHHYPGWHIALCCFDNRTAVASTPLLWWFEPMFAETLMAPAIDAHSGNPPDLSEEVPRDHDLIFGTTERSTGTERSLGMNPQPLVPNEAPGLPIPTVAAGLSSLSPIRLGRLPTDVAELMPSLAFSVAMKGPRPNGDFLLDVSDLDQGARALRHGILS